MPGIDVDDSTTFLFLANSKLRTGAIVCLKWKDTIACRRVAVFDLECEDERGLNWISSERDTQGNLILSWAFLEQGKSSFMSHACLKESELYKKSKSKIAFEDFADPMDRLHLEIDKARFDFRDHGNVLGLTIEKANETTVR